MTVVNLLNQALTRLFDLLCLPMLGLHPLWAMIVISLLTGVLMLWIFGKVSNQDAIQKVKDRIRGNLIAVRLFQDDIGVVLKVQGRILRDTLTYMKYSVIPMLILMVPVVLIIIQLNLRFDASPLPQGAQAVVTLKVRDASILNSRAELEVPQGVVAETPGVHILSEGEVSWRIRAEEPGVHRLVFRIGGEEVDKELKVGEGWGKVTTLRTGKSLTELLLYPGEAPIPASSPVESIVVNYPKLSMPILGMNIHWLAWFFILSVAFGFAFKDVLGIQV